VDASAGRSEAWKNGPREVPPRISTQGIFVCMVICRLGRRLHVEVESAL
jgi:hypothetical protein